MHQAYVFAIVCGALLILLTMGSLINEALTRLIGKDLAYVAMLGGFGYLFLAAGIHKQPVITIFVVVGGLMLGFALFFAGLVLGSRQHGRCS